MFKRNLWKIVLSAALAAWAISELIPLKDEAFAAYVKSHATAKTAEFAKLVDEAAARTKAGAAGSEYVALKQIGKERKLDLTQYFPGIRLEDSLKNIEKRNEILLGELFRRSKGRLQLGLDLKGGVAFTLEVDERVAAIMSGVGVVDAAAFAAFQGLNVKLARYEEGVVGVGLHWLRVVGCWLSVGLFFAGESRVVEGGLCSCVSLSVSLFALPPPSLDASHKTQNTHIQKNK